MYGLRRNNALKSRSKGWGQPPPSDTFDRQPTPNTLSFPDVDLTDTSLPSSRDFEHDSTLQEQIDDLKERVQILESQIARKESSSPTEFVPYFNHESHVGRSNGTSLQGTLFKMTVEIIGHLTDLNQIPLIYPFGSATDIPVLKTESVNLVIEGPDDILGTAVGEFLLEESVWKMSIVDPKLGTRSINFVTCPLPLTVKAEATIEL